MKNKKINTYYKSYEYSTHLFPTPSYLSGASTILDIGGTFNDNNLFRSSNFINLKSDWAVIGSEMQNIFPIWIKTK